MEGRRADEGGRGGASVAVTAVVINSGSVSVSGCSGSWQWLQRRLVVGQGGI